MRFVLRLLAVLLLFGSVLAFRQGFFAFTSPEPGSASANLPSKAALPTLTPRPTMELVELTPTAVSATAPSATVEADRDANAQVEVEGEPNAQADAKVEVKTTVVTRIVIVTPVPTITPTPTATPLPSQEELVARYGSQLFPSVEQMPADLQAYFVLQVDEVANYFNVFAEDIIAVLQAQNEGGLRIQAPAGQEALGVARMTPRVWNGWANPQSEEIVTDVRLIEQYGGVGFDWTMGLVWEVWREKKNDGRSLSATNADPNDFEDSLAAVARLLARQGLLRGSIQAAFSTELRLAEAIAHLNGEFPLENAIPTSENEPVVSPQLRTAYYNLMDQTFGVGLSEAELDLIVDRSPIALEVWNWELSVDEGANQLLDQTIAHYLAEGEVAHEANLPLPWPFVYDEETLKWQREAVRLTGHTFVPWELDELLRRYDDDDDDDDDEEQLMRRLSNRADARLFASTNLLMESELNRSWRGLRVTVNEVAELMQSVLAHNPISGMNIYQMQDLTDQMEYHLRTLPEYQELNGIRFFSATPMEPMPRIIKPFGVPARYQSTGYHSGIDIRNRRQGGKEPLLYAVDDGYVVYVGPLYCNIERKCRGTHAIIIDHGNNIYTAYSHNSEAHVEEGQSVEAGDAIGRQGNEGYSRGSHLHFEVVVGCRWSGDWIQPWGACNGFVNPSPWLPPASG